MLARRTDASPVMWTQLRRLPLGQVVAPRSERRHRHSAAQPEERHPAHHRRRSVQRAGLPHEIVVESARMKGSRFSFRLPVVGAG